MAMAIDLAEDVEIDFNVLVESKRFRLQNRRRFSMISITCAFVVFIAASSFGVYFFLKDGSRSLLRVDFVNPAADGGDTADSEKYFEQLKLPIEQEYRIEVNSSHTEETHKRQSETQQQQQPQPQPQQQPQQHNDDCYTAEETRKKWESFLNFEEDAARKPLEPKEGNVHAIFTVSERFANSSVLLERDPECCLFILSRSTKRQPDGKIPPDFPHCYGRLAKNLKLDDFVYTIGTGAQILMNYCKNIPIVPIRQIC